MEPAPATDVATPDVATGAATGTTDVATSGAGAAACPFPHAIASALPGCPVPHGEGAVVTDRPPVQRSKADMVVRRLLRIPERPAHVSEAAANSAFQKSMMISGLRCTLTYVIFPIVMPLVGIARGVDAILGIVIGTFAIVCDVFTIRRFFAADHRYRWWFSGIALGIVSLLFVLLAEDIIALAT
jgi:hypothetical protein